MTRRWTAYLEAAISALPSPSDHVDKITILPQPPPLASPSLRVMTWNIAWARGAEPGEAHHRVMPAPEAEQNLRAMAAVIRQESPDIVLLQECDLGAMRSGYLNQAEFLARCGGFGYVAQALSWRVKHLPFPRWTPWHHHGYVRAGGSVLSRWPLRECRVHLYPKPRSNPWWYNAFYPSRYTQHVQVQWRGQWWSILNSHLEAYDRANRIVQAASLSKTIQTLGDGLLLYGGDFNTTPPEALQKHDFPDEPKDDYRNDTTLNLLRTQAGFAELVAPPDPQEDPCWWTFPSARPTRRLDYIFYQTKTLQLTERRIGGACGLSDHRPVIAAFTAC